MQLLKARTATPLLALTLVALFSSCLRSRTMMFASPSGKQAIEVWQMRMDNAHDLEVDLVRAQSRVPLFRRHRESIVYFVHVYWSSDEKQVGILATGSIILHLAFDTQTGKEINFARVQEGMRQSIRQAYSVPPDEDPIQWAAMNPAIFAFRRKHPEIHLTYAE